MNISAISPVGNKNFKSNNVSFQSLYRRPVSQIETKPRTEDEIDIPLEVWRSLLGGNETNSCTDYGHLVDGHVARQQVIPELDIPDVDDYLFTGDDACYNTDDMYKRYYDELHKTCFDRFGQIKPEVEKYLTARIFTIQDNNGNKEIRTIPQYLKDNIKKIDPEIYKDYKPIAYHGTDTFETAEKIMRTGFRYSDGSRALYGPGIYLSGDEGQAMNYGSCIMKYKINSDRAGFAGNKFYDNLQHSKVAQQVLEDLGIEKTGDDNTDSTQYHFAVNLIGNYVRNYIRNTMKMDFIKCPVGYVVLNDLSLKLDAIR